MSKGNLNIQYDRQFNKEYRLKPYEAAVHDGFNKIVTIYYVKFARRPVIMRYAMDEDPIGDAAIMGRDIPYTQLPNIHTVFPFVKRR